jgi:hypothetical protein
MEKEITIKQLVNAIKKLPPDKVQHRPDVWYKNQKEHWLGWLAGYSGPGAYDRNNWHRDARFVYNHVVCPELLIYLIKAIPLRQELDRAATIAYKSGSTQMEKAGSIRKVVPWSEIYRALWG